MGEAGGVSGPGHNSNYHTSLAFNYLAVFWKRQMLNQTIVQLERIWFEKESSMG